MSENSHLLHYHVNSNGFNDHTFEITLNILNPNPAGQTLCLPAWIPGSYMIRDFSKHIIAFAAYDHQQQPLSFKKIDKQTWQLAATSAAVKVVYRVYAFDYSVRGSYLANDFGFYNGTSLFLAVEGQTDIPIGITIEKPNSADCLQWRVSTTLATCPQTPLHEFGEYSAEDYADLIDHPVLMTDYQMVEFEVDEVNFELVLAEGLDIDGQRIAADLSKICQHHLSLFNSPAPIKRYVFMTLLCDDGFGGLEHRSSTALISPRADLPAVGTSNEISSGYRTFLSLCSHELFHTWLVKRIRPQELKDAVLSHEAYTQQLWIYEGFTSFYDDMALVRSGVISPQSYLEVLGQLLTRIERNPGRLQQTVSESSFDAWTRFYQQDENAANAIVSYYTKGAVIAMGLDLTIRQQTQQHLSLDDVVRALWQQYGLTDIGTPENVIQEVTQLLGVDCSDYLHNAVNTTTDIDIQHLLAKQGIKVVKQSRSGLTDLGGSKNSQTISNDFGATINKQTNSIVNAVTGSPAKNAGLAKGDILVALDGWKVTAGNLQSILDRYPHGENLTLHVFRRGKLLPLSLPVEAAKQDSIYTEIADEEKAMQWLKS
ncbi:PDZ domain-containing protein [Alteromonadaceae bacterium BrNp21-10]|nr:PDZ domain-containing protein [Alteromonadaceae bacterium BrNp21-10]